MRLHVLVQQMSVMGTCVVQDTWNKVHIFIEPAQNAFSSLTITGFAWRTLDNVSPAARALCTKVSGAIFVPSIATKSI